MSRAQLYAAFSKVEELDDGTLHVEGVASSESRDSQGEVILAEAMRKALPEYLRFPALREMHQSWAAGKTVAAEVRDDGTTYIATRVVDAEAVKKVKAGVYAGFSIGGSVMARDPKDPSVIADLSLTEISLVDRPANPDAVFQVIKIDGGVMPEQQTSTAIAKGGEVYDARMALEMLAQAQSLLSWEKSEEHPEPPEQIAALQVIVQKLKEFIASEIMEGEAPAPAAATEAPAVESTEEKADEPEAPPAESEKEPEAEKAATLTDLAKQIGEAQSTLTKCADALARMAPEPVAKAAEADLQKRADVAEAGLIEAGEALRKVMAERDEYAALLKRKGSLRVVEKSADVGGDSAEKGAEPEPKNTTESIKRIHAAGGRPLVKL